MYETMIASLGKHHNDGVVTNLLSSIGDNPEVMNLEITYYIYKKKGMNLVFDENLMLSSIQLYPQGVDGYDEYTGDLPQGIRFHSSRAEVRSKFGNPTASGGGNVLPILGMTRQWDRFDYDTHTLHFEYQVGEETISLITLGAKVKTAVQ